MPSGAWKAMRMKKLLVCRSQNWLLSAMFAPRAASSVVTAATMPGLSSQDSTRMDVLMAMVSSNRR
ncbi:hypothetical protein D3C80_1541710 [compost metagenome]